ncbi:16S rRNA (guanine(527)-N(7))-methyltransferase RsmG [Roseivivax isoporae]|nr:16S rRNA (guanine(527)-N(7))-methyltransferase RsmG [Roseivivax isoporae]
MTVAGSGPSLPDVSRETTERLEIYETLLRKWNPRINLVSRSTLPEIRTRHIADSLQLLPLAGQPARWSDLGSGGGMPGIVCAIAGAELMPETRFTLVEADIRKATFLRTVLRETGVRAEVIAERIERTTPLQADCLSARALADLGELLTFATLHLVPAGKALFPKGATWEKEVEAARARWNFTAIPHRSMTHPEAVILEIGDVSHV